MTIRSGIRSGLGQGIQGGIVPVMRDGPGDWYVPQSSHDFTVLGLTPPTFLWLCQEASGSLANVIGSSLALAANATGHTYRNRIAGWNRYFLGTDGATSAQSWRTTSALLDMASGTSAAMVCLASVAVPAASTRHLMSMGGGQRILGISAPDGFLRPGFENVFTNGDVAQGPITTVHQFCWYRNATANESGALSDTDSVIGTHNEGTVSGAVKGLGACGAFTPATARIGWFGIWMGAAAEQDWPAYLATLRGE